jgi:hypothetical protein
VIIQALGPFFREKEASFVGKQVLEGQNLTRPLLIPEGSSLVVQKTFDGGKRLRELQRILQRRRSKFEAQGALKLAKKGIIRRRSVKNKRHKSQNQETGSGMQCKARQISQPQSKSGAARRCFRNLGVRIYTRDGGTVNTWKSGALGNHDERPKI